MRGVAILVAALAMVAASGCGGSEEDAARDVVKRYAEAIAEGDEKEVCDTLTEDSRKQLDRGGCEKAYSNFGAFLDREQKDKLRDLEPDVKIDGAKATTAIPEEPLKGEVRLEKQDGEWRIASP
jgi:ketosteroid isomerase-like protein